MRAASIPNRAAKVALKCLLLAPLDPLTGELRSGPLRRYLHPPPGVTYSLATDRLRYPQRAARYKFDPAFVGLAAIRFAVEHTVRLKQRNFALAHSFFLDLRKFLVPWVHESDESFGQFLSSYMGVKGLVKRKATELFSTYLNADACKGVIAWSHWARGGFVEDGVDRSKVHVIPPPFETIQDRRTHKGCNILFIGRDFSRKGGDIALNAFDSIYHSEGSRLIYVGKLDESGIRRKVKEDRRIVHMASPTTRTLREDVWPVTDILLLPTRADAFAISVVEAMCRGIPVIATALPAVAEIVEHKVSGFLAPLNNSHIFSRDLERLVQDASLRRNMGRQAKRRVNHLFSPRAVSRALGQVYINAV